MIKRNKNRAKAELLLSPLLLIFTFPTQTTKRYVALGNIKALRAAKSFINIGHTAFHIINAFAIAAYKVVMLVAIMVVMGGAVEITNA